MASKLRSALGCASLALTLTGCASFGGTDRIKPPAVPADIVACFDRLVPEPRQKELTRQDVFRLIERLRVSEKEKSVCGKRLIAWHETTR